MIYDETMLCLYNVLHISVHNGNRDTGGIFFHLSMKTYTVGTHWNHLTEAILMSTHSIFFYIFCGYSLESPCSCNSNERPQVSISIIGNKIPR